MAENGHIPEMSKSKEDSKCMVTEKGQNSDKSSSQSTDINNKDDNVVVGSIPLNGCPLQSVLSTWWSSSRESKTTHILSQKMVNPVEL